MYVEKGCVFFSNVLCAAFAAAAADAADDEERW